MPVRIYIVFEVPALIADEVKNASPQFCNGNDAILYPIKVDTDLKQTLAELCIKQSDAQKITDAAILQDKPNNEI